MLLCVDTVQSYNPTITTMIGFLGVTRTNNTPHEIFTEVSFRAQRESRPIIELYRVL